MRTARLVAGLAFIMFTGIALVATNASAAPAHLVLGTIASVSAETIVVTGRDGKPVSVKTNSGTRIVGRAPGRFEDIKNGDVVTVVATKAQDGSLTAVTIQDVPSGLQFGAQGRGGQRELKSGKVLVRGSVVGAQGNTLSVTSADAVVTAITVPQDAQVRRITPLTIASLAPGARVALQGTDNPDGSVTAVFILVGENAPR
jgi:translation initiation factor IF-1